MYQKSIKFIFAQGGSRGSACRTRSKAFTKKSTRVPFFRSIAFPTTPSHVLKCLKDSKLDIKNRVNDSRLDKMRLRKQSINQRMRTISSATSSSQQQQQSIDKESSEQFWKASIDFKRLQERKQETKKNAENRNVKNVNVEKICELYEEFLAMQKKGDQVRQLRNLNAQKVKECARDDQSKKQREELVAEGKRLKDDLQEIDERLQVVERELQMEGQKVPNDTHPLVPVGGEELAQVLSVVGEKRVIERMLDHVAIGEKLGMFDFETASKVSGTRFVYLTGVGALLELALINWAMQKAISKGFEPMIVPDLVKKSVVEKCGFQPRAENTQVYSIENSELCLAGTAELLLGGKCMDQTYEEKDLPKKFVAFSHCVRTEAGAAGAQTRGMYRLHQFSKVEMFAVTTPEESNQMHEELSNIEKEMYAELGLHFKVLDMSSHDLGAPAYRKFDIEAWMPALERYGEISSASNCTDFQARRLNIKYRPNAVDSKKQPLQFAHTLNATACAVPRMIICILENFQNEDGSVTVPDVLRPYLGGLEKFKPI